LHPTRSADLLDISLESADLSTLKRPDVNPVSRINSPLWIFPSNSRKGHLTGTAFLSDQIVAQGVKVYPHYLRKTFTTAAALCCKGDIVDILTDHVAQGVTAKHYTAPSVEQLRPSIERITAELLRMTGIEQTV